jgi:hypothetical protein
MAMKSDLARNEMDMKPHLARIEIQPRDSNEIKQAQNEMDMKAHLARIEIQPRIAMKLDRHRMKWI